MSDHCAKADAQSTRDGVASDALFRDLPDGVREVMFPDEKIIWMQRGHGVRWPLIYTAMPVLSFLLMAFLTWLFFEETAHDFPGSPGPLVMSALVAAVWTSAIVFIYGRIILGPSHETYVLTDLRVIHHTGFLIPVTHSLTPRQHGIDRELMINRLAIWGERRRGWLMLRPDSLRPPYMFAFFPSITSLVGVKNPLDVAALIKSTLELDFEIEDNTH